MGTRSRALAILVLLLTPLAVRALATAFLYQGRLVQAGAAPTGTCDLAFTLYDAAAGGVQVGDTISLAGVAMANGLFTVPLDFGAGAFQGADRWLEIAARPAGGVSYAILAPRQPLAPAPYALFARAVNWDGIQGRPSAFGVYTAGSGLTLAGQEFAIANNGVTAAMLADGAVTGTKLADNAVTTAKIADGAITTNDLSAGAVTDIKIASLSWSKLSGVPAGFADGIDNDTVYTAGSGLALSGAQFSASFAGTGSATTVARSDHAHDAAYWKQGGGNAFGAVAVLGTTEKFALEVKVNNDRMLRLEPTPGSPNIMLGSPFNSINSGNGSVIGGGGGVSSTDANTINGTFNTIGGGLHSVVSADYAFIGGGYYNLVNADYASIGGGYSNQVNAAATYGTIAGGRSNVLSATTGTIGGGFGNAVTGNYGTVAGGVNCAAGSYAFAAGFRAKATQDGSFAWADHQDVDFTVPFGNIFAVRAANGIWLGTSSTPSIPAGRFLNTSTGGYLSSTGTWTNSCDRALKTAFARIDAGELLEKLATLPITAWRYKAGAGERHLGPTAQDFRAAFGLGLDDVSISTVDGIGVALAAAQALGEKVTRLESENAVLRANAAEVDDLRARLEKLEAAMARMTGKQ